MQQIQIKHNQLCEYCGKSYTRKVSLQRHTLLCEVVHKTKREKICDEEENTDIPSRAQLYQIIQELAAKYDSLNEKMQEMQKWVQTKKKKLDIIQWLNTNKPVTNVSLSFQIWTKKIQVQETHIQLLMEENIVQTINTILRDNLLNEKPVAAFVQKNNIIYCQDETTCNWKQLESDEFILLIKQIHSKILRELCEWRNKNASEIASNDKMSELYNKTVIKLMGLNFSQDSTALSKIRVNLYNSLKIEFKQTIEFEI